MNPELRPLADLIESLSREIHEGFARLDARFEAMNALQDLRVAKLERGRPEHPS